jgi:hypothetical protein
MIIGISVVFLGIYQVVDATQRFNHLDAIPIQNLLDSAKENPTNAETIVLLDKQKRDTLVQRSEAMSVIGVGAVILGVMAFVFTRVPYPQEAASANESVGQSLPS